MVFVLSSVLQGKATRTACCPRVGAFLLEGNSVDAVEEEELAEWLAKDGKVTVVSLGSQSAVDTISEWAMKDLLKGCLQGSERVLAACKELPSDPELQKAEAEGRLKTQAWLPLAAVLGHERVACFLSHCGANSTQECVMEGKPIVPLPFFNDQYYIAQVLEEAYGYTANEDYSPLRKQDLRASDGAAVAKVQEAIQLALAVPSDMLESLRMTMRGEEGARVAAEMVRDRVQTGPSRKYTLYYHTECKGFYGKGWSPLAMLKHAGKPYEVKGPDQCPEGIGFEVPMLTFPGGDVSGTGFMSQFRGSVSIAQSNVIVELLGEKLGLAPKDFASSAKAKQLVADQNDLFGELYACKPADLITKWLDYLEAQVAGDAYFLECGLTYVDFAMYPVLLFAKQKIQAGDLAGVTVPARLQAWCAKMGELPAVVEMDASGIPLLPPKSS